MDLDVLQKAKQLEKDMMVLNDIVATMDLLSDDNDLNPIYEKGRLLQEQFTNEAIKLKHELKFL